MKLEDFGIDYTDMLAWRVAVSDLMDDVSPHSEEWKDLWHWYREVR